WVQTLIQLLASMRMTPPGWSHLRRPERSISSSNSTLAPWGHKDGAHSRRECQGSRRDSGLGEERARDHSGLAHGRGARPRDDAQARTDRVGRDRGHRARGSLDAHGALNDRDTGAEAAVTFSKLYPFEK